MLKGYIWGGGTSILKHIRYEQYKCPLLNKQKVSHIHQKCKTLCLSIIKQKTRPISIHFPLVLKYTKYAIWFTSRSTTCEKNYRDIINSINPLYY